jgi:Rrf2 family protein
MGLIFSQQCEYAIQAVLYLALKEPGEWASVKEIRDRLRTPAHFLAKIFQDLTKKNILLSLKGPTSGFALARPAEQIKLLEIVKAIDGNDLFEECAMGFPDCSPESPCAIHEHWRQLRSGLEQVLANKGVAEVAHEMKRLEYRK